jgi:DNA replication protein DnaC
MMVLDDSEIVEHIKWSVPKRYQGCRFSTFDAYTKTLIQKVAAIQKLIADRRSVFLFGAPGVGKTHLAVSALAEFIKLGVDYKFVGCTDYVYTVQAAFGNPKDIVRELVDNNVVLIDDLASEKATESARSSLLFLIDQIYSRRKIVIVTSNESPKQIHAFEPRIASRLSEMCGFVELVAEDFRIRAAGQRQKLVQPRTGVTETVN